MALVGEEGVKSTEQVPDDRVQVPAGVPVKVPEPTVLGVYVRVQEPEPAVALERVHAPALLNSPLLSELKLTIPATWRSRIDCQQSNHRPSRH